MIYPGYIPKDGVEPILMHYGLPFNVGNWSFSKLEHHDDGIVYDCNRLFPEPPYPREVNVALHTYESLMADTGSITCLIHDLHALIVFNSVTDCRIPNFLQTCRS